MVSGDIRRRGGIVDGGRRVLAGAATIVAASGLATAGCASVGGTTAAASRTIAACSPAFPSAHGSDRIKVGPSQYNSLVATAQSELLILRRRAVTNGGKILVNDALGTGVKATRRGLDVLYNATAGNPGFKVEVRFKNKGPEQGPDVQLGALVCNTETDGPAQMTETNFAGLLPALVADTMNYPS
jgi:hypothetical protein